MLPIKNYILLIFLILSQFVFAQDFEFNAKASSNKVAVNQRFKIEFTVNKEGVSDFKLPDLAGFKTVGSTSSSRTRGINGKVIHTISVTYILQPKKIGNYTIPPASVMYKGKQYQSNPVTITVTEKVAVPKDPNDPTSVAQENIFLVASVSNSTPYVGESVYVEYRFYYKNVMFNNVQYGEDPKFEGFWSQEISVKGETEKTTQFKGETYNYYNLKKVVLIPQKSGKLYVEPIELDMVVSVFTGRRDVFGRRRSKRANVHFSSGKKLILVKDLPTKGKPANFTGAVGDFNLNITASKDILKANEATQVKVWVSGVGNTKLIEMPKLIVPSELEMYDPERQQSIRATVKGLKGSITDNYSIVPAYRGKYIIPSLDFSYFNPKEAQYHSVTTEPIAIDVTEGKELPSTVTNSNQAKKIVSTTGGDFRYIKTQTRFKTTETTDFYGSRLFYLLLLLPMLFIPIGVIFGRKYKKSRADVSGNKVRIADKLAKKYLSQAKKQLHNKEAFYIALEKALHNFLKAKLHIETADISQEKITDLLLEHQVSEGAITNFTTILNDCDYARYSPATERMMQEAYNKASKAIALINTELR